MNTKVWKDCTVVPWMSFSVGRKDRSTYPPLAIKVLWLGYHFLGRNLGLSKRVVVSVSAWPKCSSRAPF